MSSPKTFVLRMPMAWSLVLCSWTVGVGSVLRRVDVPTAGDDGRAPLCLDGSPYAFGFREGHGRGRNRWLIHLQGGAWCATQEECLSRRGTGLGTSHGWGYFEEPAGVLSDDSEINPDMFDWNTVFLPYCDGSSFLSDRHDPVDVGGTQVFMRGHAIFRGVINHLLAKRRLSEADAVVLTGCSSGALGALLNLDRLKEMLSWQAPHARVLGLSDAGWFVDTPEQILRWRGALALWNATHVLPSKCLAAEAAAGKLPHLTSSHPTSSNQVNCV